MYCAHQSSSSSNGSKTLGYLAHKKTRGTPVQEYLARKKNPLLRGWVGGFRRGLNYFLEPLGPLGFNFSQHQNPDLGFNHGEYVGNMLSEGSPIRWDVT